MRPPRADAAKRTQRARWQIDFATFGLVEQGQERRPGGRVDHTLTYERAAPALNEGRYRVRLVVSGDRLTEVTHFIRIPEAFTRRYQNMRSANEAIGIASVVGMMLLYVVGGIGVGLFYMLRSRWVLWRQAAAVGRGGRAAAGARHGERVAADVDDVRHGRAARDVSRPADRDGRRDVRRASPSFSACRSWRRKP